jgi:hypothetical protein
MTMTFAYLYMYRDLANRKNVEVGTEMGTKTFNNTVEGISSSTHFNTHFNFGNLYIREMGTV